MPLLELKNLHVSIDGTPVLNGVNLQISEGEFHALMGPNGSGKSSLAMTIAGHPSYAITEGTIRFQGTDINKLPPEKRAKLGIFLSFQHPAAVPGVSVANLVRTSYRHTSSESKVDVKAFRARLTKVMEELHMKPEMLDRSVNDGFSGGEKKMAEIFQLAILEPRLAILDEIDSGLDLDAMKRVTAMLATLRSDKRAFLLITHNPRILADITPDAVHVFSGGKIVQSGTSDLLRKLEKEGFEKITA